MGGYASQDEDGSPPQAGRLENHRENSWDGGGYDPPDQKGARVVVDEEAGESIQFACRCDEGVS